MAVATRNRTCIKNGLRPEYPKKPRRYSEESMATRAEYPRGPRPKKPRTPRKRIGRSNTPNGSFFVSCTSTDGNSDVQYFIATPTPRSTATPEPTPKKAAPKKRATRTRAPRALATPPPTPKKRATPKKRTTRTQTPSRSVTSKPAQDQRDWREETPSRLTPPREAKYDNPYGGKRKVPPTKGRGKTPRAGETPVPTGVYAPSLPPTRYTTAPPNPRRTPGRPTTARSTIARATTARPTVGDVFGEHPGEETDSEDVDPDAEAAKVKAVAKSLKNKVSRVSRVCKVPEDDKHPSTFSGKTKAAVAAFKTAAISLAPQELPEPNLTQKAASIEQQADRTEQQAALAEDLRQRELAVSLREQAEALAVERAEEREEMARATALAAQVRQDLVETELRELRAKVGEEEEVSARQSSGGSYHYFRRFMP